MSMEDPKMAADGAGGAAARASVPMDSRQLVGDSPAMRRLCRLAADVARRRSTIVLLGETGTGKELFARYIHQCSERAIRPFVPVDCAALPEPLFESQLFGHAKGAFTGASRESLGALRSADGGTLFLDEIGELNLNV